MPWPSWLGRRDKEAEAAAAEKAAEDAAAAEAAARRALALRAIADFFGIPPSSSTTSRPEAPPPTATPTAVSWDESLAKTNWQHYSEPQAWLPPALAVGAALGFSAFYRSYLRRIPGTNYIQPRYFRRRSLFGKVTSVGDGDNFHLFHTPGGRLAGWGWLRHVPTLRKDLRGKTIPVRIAGVDAPEGAHFGRPAQPYSGEALEFLTQYLLGRHVRAYLYRRDQYDRVVARVVVRRFWFFKHDVGVEMLKRGLATCYEARTGVEFGGREAAYRIAEAEAKARSKGMWSGGAGRANETATASSNVKPGEVETPRAYKTRMAAMDAANGTVAGTTKAPPSFTSHKPAHPSSAGKK